MNDLKVRPARKEDIELTFQWANDRVLREMSFNSDPITWEEHQQWFETILKSQTLYLIAELRGIPVGQVRIEQDGVVAVFLDPKYRGMRLSHEVLSAAIDYHDTLYPSKDLIAFVKPENEPSQKLFIGQGFKLVSLKYVREK